jgi:hypothetical protein
MTITLTPNISLKKLEYRDTDYPDWETVENKNMDILDLALGDFQYTEENYVTSSTPPVSPVPITITEDHSQSLDSLDITLEAKALLMPTAGQKVALVGEGGAISGTADATVTTTNTTLNDTRLAMIPNKYVGSITTCNGKTMTITANTVTEFTGASWSGGGNPGNGFAWLTISVPNTGNKYIVQTLVRPSRKRVLFPEATGAVLTPAPGGANTGNMTSTAMTDGNYRFNYYQWLSDSVVAFQSYDISVQWRVPDTFLGFNITANKALTVDICTQENATTNNKVDVIIKKDGIATTSSITSKCSTVADTWYAERKIAPFSELIGFDRTDTILSSLVAGDTLDITIRVYSWNSKYVNIGAVTVQYIG